MYMRMGSSEGEREGVPLTLMTLATRVGLTPEWRGLTMIFKF